MKIDSVETFIAHNWLFVKITTDNGLIGVGESTFFGWPEATREIVHSFRDYLVGNDPLPVEHHWLWMFRNKSMRGGAIGGAISSIDQALWDIRGKHFQAPVWSLLGGKVRDKIRAMLVIGMGGTSEEVAKEAQHAVENGYTAVKVCLFQHDHVSMRHGRRIQDLIERAEAIRESIGWDVDMGIEIHRNMNVGDSIVLAEELAPLRPLFFEDPVPPDSVLSFGEVSKKSRIPMAAGERNLNMWEFREYIEHAGVHHIRPDVGIAGGITHVKKICALAEAHHQGIIPHAMPSGPIATAAQIQLGAAIPNWLVQEHLPQEIPPWTLAVKQVPILENGHLLIPETPGLGIELDEKGVEQIPRAADLHPTALRDDGSVGFY